MLSDRYNPKEVEDNIYKKWIEGGYFRAEDLSTKPPFSIIMPPPNVTGRLHMGHALDHSIQDFLIRWKRMGGFNVLWLPGTDHAGIATQAVVERELKRENLTRLGLGREQFVKKVWEWRGTYGDRIYEQMKRLGDSCDWERARFTLDENVSRSVKKVFVRLYEKGMIYRGRRLINWSTPLETAISDLEVEFQEIKGSLYHIQYPLEVPVGELTHITVATTRPETLLGDTAVCVNPEDERYQALVGKNVLLPLTKRKIRVISDVYVDQSFGSGVVKITPAHDFNDYKIGKTHNLEFLNILNKNGTLNEEAGVYAGLKIQEARKRVIQDLKEKGLLVKEEPHVHMVGHCSRSGAVVEPFLSEQWFVQMDQLATPARRAVENGTIEFIPESWTKVYLHWLSIIEDWCISRQLWWGHRVPAWYCQKCHHINVSEGDPKHCSKCQSTELRQDEDVLDTWFSSALWPFSTMGWPTETETQKTFYPTNIMVTGHDIIFFWVARMIMMGLEFKKDVPFRKVYIHGLIRDAQGRKMSKSLGNSIDPVDMIDKYGADSLRFTLINHLYSGKDSKFSEQKIEGYRNFMNKIWNASRFVLSHLQASSQQGVADSSLPAQQDLSSFDRWIVYKLSEVMVKVEVALEQCRFSDASNALYHFIWHEFCDWYIEFSKPVLSGANLKERAATELVMVQVLNRWIRLLHPFCPFITEEIYQKLPFKGAGACMIDAYPQATKERNLLSLGDISAAKEVELVRAIIESLRNIRGENRISPAVKVKARILVSSEDVQKILGVNRSAIMSLAKIEELEITDQEANLSKCALTPVSVEEHFVKVVVPLEGLVDFDEEIKRLAKNIEKIGRETQSLSSRLTNEKFLANADPEVVELDRQNLQKMKKQLIEMQESLIRFQS